MKSKIFALILLTVIIASLALVSAQISLSAPDALSKSKNNTSFTISNPADSNLTYNLTIRTPINFTDERGNIIQISPSASSVLNLVNGTSATINLSYSNLPSFNLGAYTSIIYVYAPSNASVNAATTASYINSYCDYGIVPTNVSGLEISKVTDEKLDNEDEWEWEPLDNIEISVKVYNRYTSDLDVNIEYGLYDPITRTFVDLDEEVIDASIDEDENSEISIKFQVPADIDELSNYRFYVKAYEDGNEDGICTDKKESGYYKTVSVSKESQAAILDSIRVESSVMCGDEVTLSANVYNIGTSDQDNVLVTLYNKELGINSKQLFANLDSGDSKSVSFTFKIPANATEKSYSLDLKTYFKYDNDNSGCSNDEETACYDKDSLNDLDRTFKAVFTVEGNCIKPEVTTEKVDITASLQSEKAEAGKEIVIKSTVKNSGNSSQTYAILVSGADTFATVQKIGPQGFTLEAGKSQDVLITLKANDDAKGDYTFNIKAVYGSKTKEQPVTLSIEAKTGIFSRISNSFSNFKGNWFIWLIVAINVILILIIIIMIVKIAKK